jgi:hypothetical protein
MMKKMRCGIGRLSPPPSNRGRERYQGKTTEVRGKISAFELSWTAAYRQELRRVHSVVVADQALLVLG